MDRTRDLQKIRLVAAALANAEDGSIWRWFSELCEDHRIRWCRSGRGWLVTVDNKHVATERSFDAAIRLAKCTSEALPLARKRSPRTRLHGETNAQMCVGS
jgi:hypothetical protein